MRGAVLRRSVAIALLAAGGAGCLAGCLAGPPPPRDHFYRLMPGAAVVPAQPEPALPGVLVVERLWADPLTRDRALVWSPEAGGGVLERHRYHHWVEPPADAIQQHMVDALAAARVARTVATPQMRVRPDYRLGGRLERFERVLGGGGAEVLVEMRLNLQETAEGSVLWSGHYRVRRAAAGDAVPDAVEAFGEALEGILAQLARDLAREVQPPGPPETSQTLDTSDTRERAGADAMLAPRA